MRLHLVGYHDAFPIKIKELIHYDCFADTILVEVPLDFKDYFSKVSDEIRKADDKKLKLIFLNLERKLKTNGISLVASKNIASLVYLKPRGGLIPCATRTKPELTYGSQRDQEIMACIEKIMETINCDATFFGGNKHAEYIANELSLPHKTLYDFRPEQSTHNEDLKLKLLKIITTT